VESFPNLKLSAFTLLLAALISLLCYHRRKKLPGPTRSCTTPMPLSLPWGTWPLFANVEISSARRASSFVVRIDSCPFTALLAPYHYRWLYPGLLRPPVVLRFAWCCVTSPPTRAFVDAVLAHPHPPDQCRSISPSCLTIKSLPIRLRLANPFTIASYWIFSTIMKHDP